MVVGLYNYNGPAIAAALDGLGKKGKVLAAVFDEDDGTLDGIENGTIQVTVVQKPFMFGLPRLQVDARSGHQPRGGQGGHPAQHEHRHRRRPDRQDQRRRRSRRSWPS